MGVRAVPEAVRAICPRLWRLTFLRQERDGYANLGGKLYGALSRLPPVVERPTSRILQADGEAAWTRRIYAASGTGKPGAGGEARVFS